MEREIRITGKGKKSFAPDMQRIRFKYYELKDTYEEALQLLRDKNAEINNGFEKLGFNNKELKLYNFSIDKEYESYETKSKGETHHKQKFIGYKLRLEYQLDCKYDGALLGKVLAEISSLHIENNEDEDYSSTKVSYFLGDIEKYKKEVLKLATDDCKEKAKILAEASGVKLGKIKCIDHSWNNLRIGYEDDEDTYGGMYYCDKLNKISYNDRIDINPRDIDVGAEVNMEFIIEE